jgi:hypothetical protein
MRNSHDPARPWTQAANAAIRAVSSSSLVAIIRPADSPRRQDCPHAGRRLRLRRPLR